MKTTMHTRSTIRPLEREQIFTYKKKKYIFPQSPPLLIYIFSLIKKLLIGRQLYRVIWNMASYTWLLKHYPTSNWAYIHCLVRINVHKVLLNVSAIFSAWVISMTPLCFVCAFMSDVILPNFDSATVIRQKKITAITFRVTCIY